MKIKVATIYLDMDTSYGLVRMEPRYRKLTPLNRLDILDSLVGLDVAVGALYNAVMIDDRVYEKMVAVANRPEWETEDRQFIDQVLAGEVPPKG